MVKFHFMRTLNQIIKSANIYNRGDARKMVDWDVSVLAPFAVLHIMSAKRKTRSSTFSPEEKRARDKPEKADESTDAVLDALSMAEDMGDKILIEY